MATACGREQKPPIKRGAGAGQGDGAGPPEKKNYQAVRGACVARQLNLT